MPIEHLCPPVRSPSFMPCFLSHSLCAQVPQRFAVFVTHCITAASSICNACRLSYIHWVADLLHSTEPNEDIRGLDIGTGASAIFPLLGARTYSWSFVATGNARFCCSAPSAENRENRS